MGKDFHIFGGLLKSLHFGGSLFLAGIAMPRPGGIRPGVGVKDVHEGRGRYLGFVEGLHPFSRQWAIDRRSGPPSAMQIRYGRGDRFGRLHQTAFPGGD